MINGFFYEPLQAINPALGKTLASNAFTQLTVPEPRRDQQEHQPAGVQQQPGAVRQGRDGGVGRDPEGRRGGLRPQRRVQVHQLHRLREHLDAAAQQLAPQRHLPQRPRGHEAGQRPRHGGGGQHRPHQGADRHPRRRRASTRPRAGWPVPPGTQGQPTRCRSRSGTSSRRTARRAGTSPRGRRSRCDFITIPHNSNLGGGSARDDIIPPMFLDPYNADDAKRHLQMEPLVEIYQDKGASECRYDPRFLAGTNTIDEYCAFEILDGKSLGSASGVGSGGARRARGARHLGRPRLRAQRLEGRHPVRRDRRFDGINPFKMGVVSASDSHTGVMGWHPENEQWPGHLGIDDAYPMAESSTIQNGTGGPSVVWAEENTRDSIFEALKRKETYGTSGPRMKVRFFGGWGYPARRLRQGLRRHRLPGRRADGRRPAAPAPPATAPRPSSPTPPGTTSSRTKLQQIQIIKGWVDAAGQHARAGLHRGRRPGQPAQPAGGARRQDLQGRSRSSAASGSARCGRTPTSTPSSTPSTTCACSRSRSAATARCGAASGSASIRSTPTSATASSRRCRTAARSSRSRRVRAPSAARTRPPTPSCSR